MAADLVQRTRRSLAEADPELDNLIKQEAVRQYKGLELIASENFTTRAVLEVNGSCLTNKYSEGYPGARYYGGNEIIDQVENLCIARALATFRLDPEKWGVNVQPYSGSGANFAVFTALLNPHDRIMGLDLPSGGHLTHGFYTAKKKVSATSIFFESLPYQVHQSGEKAGWIDMDRLEENARLFKPKILIAGGSAYPREWDYERFRRIADENDSIMHMDMAHISGLVAAGECNNPFDYCDIVTTTTHKTLRGPRAGLIFYRKGPKPARANAKEGEPVQMYDYEQRIKEAVFPGLQGGPHDHTIAGVATALLDAATPEFKAYIQQVKKNAAAMASKLQSFGYKLVTDGTENHLNLWDLRPVGLTGSKAEKVLDYSHITVNKNSVHGDKSAVTPGGVRLGASALTSRGFVEADFEKVAEFLHRGIEIALDIQKTSGKMLKDFVAALEKSEDVRTLRADVEKFAVSHEMCGFEGPAALSALSA